MSIDAWAAPTEQATYPAPVRPATCGLPACEHAQCEVAHTGGEVLCRLAGGNYDDLEQPAKDHYAAIAFSALVTMWDRAIEVGMTATVTITEEPDHD